VRRVLIVAAMVAALFIPHHSAGAEAGGCHDAVNFLWPASSRAWAHKIVHRESRGNPRAQNRRSSAAGCFQMLRLHAATYERLGFSWADRYNPIVNTWVALHLFRSAGRRPWA
jgi:hypothetical protein